MDEYYYKLSVQLDLEEVLHTREVYDVLEYIGDCGGLFDGLGYMVTATLWLLSLLGESSMMAQIINSVFRKKPQKPHGDVGRRSIEPEMLQDYKRLNISSCNWTIC